MHEMQNKTLQTGGNKHMKVYHEDLIIYFLFFFMFSIIKIMYNGSLKTSFSDLVIIIIFTTVSSVTCEYLLRSDEHD